MDERSLLTSFPAAHMKKIYFGSGDPEITKKIRRNEGESETVKDKMS